MRSYYDTLLNHLGKSNFREIKFNWQSYLQKQWNEAKKAPIKIASNSDIEAFTEENCSNRELFDSYSALLIHLERIIEQDLFEILGPFYENWKRFKNNKKNRGRKFCFQKAFSSWLQRYDAIPDSLSNYHKDWSLKNQFEEILHGIERFNSRLGSDQTNLFYQMDLSKSSSIGSIELDFDGEKPQKSLLNSEEVYPNDKSFVESQIDGNEALNLKAKAAKVKIQGRLQSVFAIYAEQNGLISSGLISQVKAHLERNMVLHQKNFSTKELMCLNYPEEKVCFFTKEIELKLQLEGQFSQEDMESIASGTKRFFPFYLKSLSNKNLNLELNPNELVIKIKCKYEKPQHVGSISIKP